MGCGPQEGSLSNKMFSKIPDNGSILCPPPDTCELKDDLGRRPLANCIMLKIDQRCADWFVLRQFRVTGTSAGKILSNNNEVRNSIGMDSNVAQSTEQALQKILQSFLKTWFSSSRSNEPMMRGTANESEIIASLASWDFVQCLYVCGMLARKGDDWLGCSPGGVA